MEIPVIYVFTHDSIGVGEDGPTHQPIEQLPSLRAIPGLIVLRPGRRQRGGRGVEGDHAAAPRARRPGPDPPGPARRSTAPNTPRPPDCAKGAYILADAPDGKPDVLLLATGSEVSPLRRGLRDSSRPRASRPAS